MLGQKLKSNDNAAMPFFDVQPGAKPYELTAQILAAIAYPDAVQTSDRVAAAAHLRAGYVTWLHGRIGDRYDTGFFGVDREALEQHVNDPALFLWQSINRFVESEPVAPFTNATPWGSSKWRDVMWRSRPFRRPSKA